MDEFEKGLLVGCIMASVLTGACPAISRHGDRISAGEACQAAGYSAGHRDRDAGIICEQWIEYAKVKP